MTPPGLTPIVLPVLPILVLALIAHSPGALPADAPTVARLAPEVDTSEAPVAPADPDASAPLGTVQLAVVGAASTAAFAGSLAGGIAASTTILDLRFAVTGRPDVWTTGGAFVGGFATTVLLSQLLVPGATLIGNDATASATFLDAWQGAWRRGRWAIAAGALGAALYFAGAALEQQEFGLGQGLILAGGVTMIGSTLAYGVLDVTGAVSGYSASRKRR